VFGGDGGARVAIVTLGVVSREHVAESVHVDLGSGVAVRALDGDVHR